MVSGRCGGGEVAGETQKHAFQLSFNNALRVEFQGARVTSDGGLILVRDLDERLGLSELMERHLSDSRRGKNIQLALADLQGSRSIASWPGTRMSTTPRSPPQSLLSLFSARRKTGRPGRAFTPRSPAPN